ncbi:hypothetical protein P8605_19980, partial [Streptomyces sp. T-3]|nr:hypothetical protein [Streptomyces sp. T-3]
MEAGPRDTAHEDQGLSSDGPEPTPDHAVPAAPDSGLSDSGVISDGPDEAEQAAADAGQEVEVELRPQRRLRIWQIAPIVILAAMGSLMFAFPLAFEFGDGGAVVAMLGLLLSCCAAGWAMMAARRVGYAWPGIPARGSGR